MAQMALKVLKVLVLGAGLSLAAAVDRPLNPTFESRAAASAPSRIDSIVFAGLKKAGIEPANLCSDAIFVRRAYLDVTGTLPTAQEAAQFIKDADPNKRSSLIDKLLDRPEFAEYQAMKWADLLRVKAEFPVNLWPNAAQAYHHWILSSIRENKPFDRFARELLTESGSNFRNAPVNFYRTTPTKEPPVIAQSIALTLMGMRAESWQKERLAGMGTFFSRIGFKETGEWKEEIVFFDQNKPLLGKAVFPDGTKATIPADRDPREVFADWLVSPKNPYFARTAVNRVWGSLLGRGIVHEVDDFRPDNPPRYPELLALLERELVDAKFDMKHIYRLILNSRTYQLSSIPRSDNPDAAAYFASYPLRRMEAEVLADAICQITGTTEKYTSPIPEPYTVIPEGSRSISLPDGSITSAFLELFGRPPRDTGIESERNNKTSAAQRLHMLNSSHLQRKIENSPKFNFLMKNAKSGQGVVSSLYLMILSRMPTEEEMKAVGAYAQNSKPRESMVDLAWALMNSTEFLYRH
jgi:hypothetical protein